MTESKLKLPFDELRTLYMRHLLLQEMGLLKEVSLYALLLEFTQRREKTIGFATTFTTKTQMMACYQTLCSIEDRYTNGIVAYQWASLSACVPTVAPMEKQQRYNHAYSLLKDAKTQRELYAAGLLCRESCWHLYSSTESMYFLELAGAAGSTEALVCFGWLYDQSIFRDTRLLGHSE